MGLSIRAYARHRGVTDTAVHKAIRSGRINALSDGTIDPDEADGQWARNTSAPKTGTQRPTVKVKVPEVDGDGGGDRGGAGAATNTGSGGTGGTSLLQARTVNEVVKAQTNKVRLARLKGELIDRPQAIAHVFKLARSERDAWLNWPARVSAQMAAKLELDAHTMHVALENAVREHLQELGNLTASVD
ncbi:elements of external origin [Rhodoferax sp.]|uniref:elements of external origin n=1 Tax=Rhodoferax sp. TaxID=50421 RepID=UPI00262CDB8E|nr:elements of external origin [Rhodoferax sp.]MDD2926374.1 elements of external origin [Rhodoferax sp.]